MSRLLRLRNMKEIYERKASEARQNKEIKLAAQMDLAAYRCQSQIDDLELTIQQIVEENK